jgi:predicted nucleotidyltransferase component of viral defense system
MKLHQNRTIFQDAIKFTAQQMNIPPAFVEKDYWVTYALFAIFNHEEIGKDTIFKGGTALSKCYNMIERFSEDIDLVVLRREGESNNKLTNKIRKISDIVNAALPEIQMEGLTQKRGMNRKTAHIYNKEFKAGYGQIRDVIVVEATWLGYYEPYTIKFINSFVGQMMLNNHQYELAKEYGVLPFELLALEPIRTLCEKIMSLVRFSYGENPVDDLKKKIRHSYDLHQLLQQKDFLDFLLSEAFEEMLLKVANDDVTSFKNNKQWLIHHPAEALIFKELDTVWPELKDTYNGEFRNLVYGDLPNESKIKATLTNIKDRLAKVSWTINF